MSQLQRKSVADKRRVVARGESGSRKAGPSSSRRKKSERSIPANTAYNKPRLWTKPSTTPENSVIAALQGIARLLLGFLTFLVSGIMRVLTFSFNALMHLMQKSKIALVVVVAVVVVLVGVAVDTGVNWGKIYPGVKVGDVDLGGKSVESAQVLLAETYLPRLNNTTVTIYADDEARQKDEQQPVDGALQEQQSLEDVQANTSSWKTDARTLQASFNPKSNAEEALRIGRDEGGVFRRIGALLFGYTLDPRVEYVHGAIEALAQEIDKTIGSPRVDFGVAINDGIATPTTGHDGWMIDRRVFEKELNVAFLQSAGASGHLVAHTEYAALRIDEAASKKTCSQINAALAYGADFEYGATSWHATPAVLGGWTQTRLVESEGEFSLLPFINEEKAKNALISNLKVTFDGEDLHLEFVKNDKVVSVKTNSQEMMPQVVGAAEDIKFALFDQDPTGSAPRIIVEETAIPGTLSIDDALGYGLISCISEYTTEFSTGAEARNHNIHLVADLLNDSIVAADGGTWSFIGTAGNCNEAAGFQAAGSIVDGEYVDEIGGGICQVATTVFNSVYNSGFPVVQRRNHSLYIASYPAGRDAAVSYPDLDLVWKNDSASDVLLRMDYNDSSVVAKLYGVDPGYRVETTEGNWVSGEKFKTKTVEDNTMQEGTSYIKTSGTDGRRISITRTVTDKNGALLHEDVFESNYDPKDEIKVVGTSRKT
ncbi:MAG: VanW family protein [Raoultibacter sp.]